MLLPQIKHLVCEVDGRTIFSVKSALSGLRAVAPHSTKVTTKTARSRMLPVSERWPSEWSLLAHLRTAFSGIVIRCREFYAQDRGGGRGEEGWRGGTTPSKGILKCRGADPDIYSPEYLRQQPLLVIADKISPTRPVVLVRLLPRTNGILLAPSQIAY